MEVHQPQLVMAGLLLFLEQEQGAPLFLPQVLLPPLSVQLEFFF